MSRNATARRAALDDLMAEEPSDNAQVMALAVTTEETNRGRDVVLREVLSGLSDRDRDRLVGVLVQARSEIIDHWRKATTHFLAVGRILNRLREQLPAEPIERLMTSYDRNERDGVGNESALPFSRATAYRLMTCARIVDESPLRAACDKLQVPFNEADCPNYTVLSLLDNLEPQDYEVFVQRGLLKPDLTQRQATNFRKEVKKGRGAGSAGNPAAIKARRQLSTLDAAIRRTELQLATLRTQRAEIIASLGGSDFTSTQRGEPATLPPPSSPEIIDLKAHRPGGEAAPAHDAAETA